MRPILTKGQNALLAFLIKYHGMHGHPPTFREIVREAKIKSTSTVSKILKILARKNYIVYHAGEERGIEIREDLLRPAIDPNRYNKRTP